MTKICSSPWNTVSIDIGGNVFSCLCPQWARNRVLGNIHNQSLEEIYRNSISLQELRQSILDGSYKFCDSAVCPVPLSLPNHHYAIEPSELKENLVPSSLMLSLDQNCNLKCSSCRSDRIFSKSIDKNVSHVLESIKQTYQNHDQDTQVFCDGSGDVFASLAYQNFLFGEDLPKCFSFMITTNGNLITKNLEKIRKIKDQIQGVIVSLDAATEQTYKKVRGGDFNIVLNGIKHLINAGIKVYLQFVLQRDNYHELLAYQEIANTLNIGYGVQLIQRWDHMTDEQWNHSCIIDNPAVDLEELKKSLQIMHSDSQCNFNGGILSLL